jgi:hypothetical protein
MVAETKEVVYFTNSGSENTDEVLRIAKRRAQQLNIKHIVVASNSGKTAVAAAEICEGMKVIAVSHVTGYREPNVQEFTVENRQKLEARGGILCTAGHAFSGLNARRAGGALPEDWIANTLRVFGAGTKVACEISVMAADAGLVRTDEDVIAIGGSHGGADTALLIQPANSNSPFDLRVKEILCKPYVSAERPRRPEGERGEEARPERR